MQVSVARGCGLRSRVHMLESCLVALPVGRSIQTGDVSCMDKPVTRCIRHLDKQREMCEEGS